MDSGLDRDEMIETLITGMEMGAGDVPDGELESVKEIIRTDDEVYEVVRKHQQAMAIEIFGIIESRLAEVDE